MADNEGTRGVELTSSQQAAIHGLLHDEQPIPAPVWLARQATVANDAVEREHARTDAPPPSSGSSPGRRSSRWTSRITSGSSAGS